MAAIPVFADVNLNNINQSAIVAVATANTGSITSIDGRTLANVTNMPSASNWNGVASGVIGGVPVIVAVSSSTNVAANSWDNVTWVARTMPASVAWAGVAFGGGYFAAVATGPTTSAAYTTDGVTWNASTIASGNWKVIASDGSSHTLFNMESKEEEKPKMKKKFNFSGFVKEK